MCTCLRVACKCGSSEVVGLWAENLFSCSFLSHVRDVLLAFVCQRAPVAHLKEQTCRGALKLAPLVLEQVDGHKGDLAPATKVSLVVQAGNSFAGLLTCHLHIAHMSHLGTVCEHVLPLPLTRCPHEGREFTYLIHCQVLSAWNGARSTAGTQEVFIV